MAENPLLGVWTLVAYEFRSANGAVTYPFGEHPQGYIMYTQDGFMSVGFMSGDRPSFKSGDLRGGSDAEKAAAYSTYFSYCGRYELRDEKVVHHIEVSLYPNWIGKDQERFWKLDGERLTFSTPPLLYEGSEQTGYLFWKKAR
jgi:hypothetical protein